MIVVYGLKNCDTCRKAMTFLEARDQSVTLHDLRADGLPVATLDDWLGQLGWEQLLNRRSTTWRGLPEAEREPLNADTARQLLLAHPTLVKRPVIQTADTLIVGFAKDQQARLEAALSAAG